MPPPRSSTSNGNTSAFGRTTRSALSMPSCRRPATSLHGYLSSSNKRRDVHRPPTAETGGRGSLSPVHGSSGVSAHHHRGDEGGGPPPQDGMDQWDRLLLQEYAAATHDVPQGPPTDLHVALAGATTQTINNKKATGTTNHSGLDGRLAPTTAPQHVDPFIGDRPQQQPTEASDGGQTLTYSIPPPLVLLPPAGRPPRPAPPTSASTPPQSRLHIAPSSSPWDGWRNPHEATRFLQALQGDADTWQSFRAQVVQSIQRHVAQRVSSTGSDATSRQSTLQRASPAAQAQPAANVGSADVPNAVHPSRLGFVSASAVLPSSRRSKAGSTATSVDSGRRAPHGRKHRSTCSTSSTVLSSLRSSEMNLMWERESVRSGYNGMA